MHRNSSQEKSQNGILFTIFVTIFLNMLGIGIIIPVIAPMFLDVSDPILPLHYTFSQRTILMGLLIAAYPISQFFGAPVLGNLSDKIGRKKVLVYSLAGSLAGYLIFALGIITQTIPLLFLGRIIDGITGGNVAVINSAIADISDEKSKTKNFGLVGMAFGIGFIIGPFIGGKLSDPLIVSWFNYSTPFLFASLLIALNIVLVIFRFPETLKKPKEVSLFVWKGIENLKKAVQMGSMRRILIVIFLVTFGFTFFTQFFQVFLIEKFSFRQSDIGELYAYVGMWIAISQGLITRITSKFLLPQQILQFSTLGLSIVFIVLLLPENSKNLFFVLPFVSMFQGLNQPNLLALLSNNTSEEMQGEIMGVNQSLQSMALAIPPLIAGFIVTININLPIVLASVCLFIAWILVLRNVKGLKPKAHLNDEDY